MSGDSKTVPFGRYAWPSDGGRPAGPGSALPGFAEPAGDRPTAPDRPAGPSSDTPATPRSCAAAVRELAGSPRAVVEHEVCEATIVHCRGSVPRVAVMLGICPSTLYRKPAVWGGSEGIRKP